jgi:hypothetical protein
MLLYEYSAVLSVAGAERRHAFIKEIVGPAFPFESIFQKVI